ncbi:metal ABC transporter permease [Slackia faecicanis]|uniref:Metal ABC transporter permease n=1 Tax=Slackia faecicanis TaxID=255723 RepID=A0A3N0AIB7_9ACTN|nr:methionine ABC transporter permease [Slackia faecicanis]RNL21531.1 metal ABC transporter permease [Slackia faecicanis]
MESIASFLDQYGALMAQGTVDSVVMTALSTAFAYALGIPLGVLLVLTAPGGLHPHRVLNAVVGWLVNIGRSIPFIILIVFMIPATRAIVGTSLGVAAAIVPLSAAAVPFVARMVEQSLSEVDEGLVEAASSFGASTAQTVFKVLLAESAPSLIRGLSITFITLFGFVAMAGTVGAGGLGDIAIRYGYQRYQDDVMIAAIVLCIVIVQLAQSLASAAARRTDHRLR